MKGRFLESWGLRASISSSPLPLPLQSFFLLRAITRLETLATQANEHFTDQIKCSLIIKELNVLEKHLCEKVWLADSL